MYKNQPFCYYYFFNCYTSQIKYKIRAHKYHVTVSTYNSPLICYLGKQVYEMAEKNIRHYLFT